MRSTRNLILALEEITSATKEIRREFPTLDPGVITTTLDVCDYDAARAAQVLIDMHVKKVDQRPPERMLAADPANMPKKGTAHWRSVPVVQNLRGGNAR